MNFHDWMRAALYDPVHGYYSRTDRARQGRTGDYRTAPETSPLFGATFARFFRVLFEELRSPKRWTICEVGAGNGDFALDVLSTLQNCYPLVADATRWVIDERLPEISKQTEEMWKSPTPFVTHFDASAFRQGLYNPTGGFNSAGGSIGETSASEPDGDSIEQPASLDPE